MIRRYRHMSAPTEPDAAHEDELLAAAQRARETGWHSNERDVICAEARRLPVVLWPALSTRLTRTARDTTYAP